MKRVVPLILLLSNAVGFADNSSTPAPSPHYLANRIVNAFTMNHTSPPTSSLSSDIAILEKGAKETPNDPRIFMALAFCYISKDDEAAYLKNIEKAYILTPKDPQVEMSYSVALRMNKQPLKALDVIKILSEEHPQLRYTVAFSETTIQQYKEAIPILETILQDPSSKLVQGDRALLLCHLGISYLYLGDHAKAINALGQAVTLFPGMIMAWTALGEAYLKNGETDKADSALDKALSINAHFSRTLYFKGLVLEKRGMTVQANKDFQIAYDNLKPHLRDNGEDYFLMFLISQKLSKEKEAEEYKAEAQQLLFTYEAPWKQQ